jgi:hypothetical protein
MVRVPKSEKLKVVYLSFIEGLIIGITVFILQDVLGLWILLIAPAIVLFSPLTDLLNRLGLEVIVLPIYYILLLLFFNYIYRKYGNLKALVIAYVVLIVMSAVLILIALSSFNPVFL